MSPDEARELQDCEGIIERGWQTVLEVGWALVTIRDRRLYRDQYKTFEAYSRDKWEYSKTHANRLIGAAQVMKVLTPIGVNCQRESQLRPLVALVGLGPEKIPAAWHRAEELAGPGQITARHVQQAANEFLPPGHGNGKTGRTHKADTMHTESESLLQLLDNAEKAAKSGNFRIVLSALCKLRKRLAVR